MNNKERHTSLGHFLVVQGLATLLAWKYASGQLHFYINERFFPLTLLAIFILWCMATVNLINSTKTNNEPMLINSTIVRMILGLISSSLPILSAFFSQTTTFVYSSYLLSALISFFLFQDSRSQTNINTATSITLLVLTLPVIIGISTPAQPLSSSTLDNRGISLTATFGSEKTSSQNFEVIEEDRTILDWLKFANSNDDPAVYIGQQANVIGFVYHSEYLNEDQFMITRFVVTCCVADALAIGLPVQTIEGMDLPENTWVHVQGTFDNINIGDETVPLIKAASIEIIAAPEQPYLYP